MTRFARIRRALGALALFALPLAATPARGHEFWLAPSSLAARDGAVVVRACAGTGFRGEPKPFAAPHCRRFVVRAGRTLELSPVARMGDLDWARFKPADGGGALFAYESDFTPITLPGSAFDDYLALEGLDAARAARRRTSTNPPGRERYRRCAKAWWTGADPDRATRPLGLPLEIVPLAVPGSGAALRVRVLRDGAPLPGMLLKAWRQPPGADGLVPGPGARDSVAVTWQARTDAHGEAVVAVAAAGEWLVSGVDMVPCAEPSEADWESTWASLWFVRPRAGR